MPNTNRPQTRAKLNVRLGRDVPRLQETSNSRMICYGPARILDGNEKLIGKPGGFNGGVRVKAGSAAIIPRQFTGTDNAGPIMRSIGEDVRGYTLGGQVFRGFTDTIGNQDISKNPYKAQDAIIQGNKGATVIELVSGRDEGVVPVVLDMKDHGQLCPPGMYRIDGGGLLRYFLPR